MVTFLSTSRYRTSTGAGSVSVDTARKPIYGTRYYMYLSRDGDTFDILSSAVLGDPSLWWKIADLNPHVPFPDQIPVGTNIRLPRA